MQKVVNKPTISILVPCYNEALTIEKCVNAWLNQTHKADQVIIADDGSTDNTLEVLKKFGQKIKVLKLKHMGNKSFVQEAALKHVSTDVFIATDADTIMDEHFVEKVFNAFQDPKVKAFAGYIKSLKHNWITGCREIDYTIGQDIHKFAQHNLDFLFVIPGCAGAFRTEDFKKLITFDHDTLTEDLDFTYKLNASGTKIHYDRGAIVYTQDPATLKSYINQMRRWYSGGFQNLIKHIHMIERPNVALELSLMYIEGLTFSALLFLAPILNLSLYLAIISFYFAYNIITGIYVAIQRNRYELIPISATMIVFNYINAYVFLEQFFKEIVLRKKNLTWFHPERRVI